jgi:hypothetical protein
MPPESNPGRPDLPVVRNKARASTTLALAAARPDARAWDLDPWPISVASLRAAGASLSMVVPVSGTLLQHGGHPPRTNSPDTGPGTLKKVLKNLSRSIKRGLPGRRLKDAFPKEAAHPGGPALGAGTL